MRKKAYFLAAMLGNGLKWCEYVKKYHPMVEIRAALAVISDVSWRLRAIHVVLRPEMRQLKIAAMQIVRAV